MIHHATQSHTPARRANQNPLDRREYLQRAAALVKRGQELPQSKLLDLDVISIRSAARQRTALLKHIKDNLSNAALSKQYGTHPRNIEKILSRQAWSHVA